MHADLLLIDEAAGRAEAKRRQLRVTGTLGVLRAGAEQGLVNVPDLLERLRTTSFSGRDTLERGLRSLAEALARDQWPDSRNQIQAIFRFIRRTATGL